MHLLQDPVYMTVATDFLAGFGLRGEQSMSENRFGAEKAQQETDEIDETEELEENDEEIEEREELAELGEIEETILDEEELTLADKLSRGSGVTPKRGETIEAFLQRLAKVLGSSDFPNDKWEEMDEETQNLANELISAGTIKKGETKADFLVRLSEEMPNIPGLNDLMETAIIESEPVKRGRGRPPGSKSKEPKGEQEAKEPKEKKVKAAKEPKVRKPSAQAAAKRIVLSDFTLTPVQLLDRLQADGFTSTVVSLTTMKADFMSTLRVLKAMGKLAEDVASRIP